MTTYTISQQQRLKELNAPEEALTTLFDNPQQCEAAFRELEGRLGKENRQHIQALLEETHLPLAFRVENLLVGWLMEKEGFTRVTTPVILPKQMLEKMTITDAHPLHDQVFWLDSKRCLRPMLAPNLYSVMKDLHRIIRKPVRIFECGPCFRKETQGAQHMNEFTMLNFVELAGVKEGEQMDRLKRLAVSAMEALGIGEYELEIAGSEVYGETLDIVVDGMELASGAYGPHVLDEKWGVFDTWVGMGFGVERIAMVMGGYQNIKRVGRSLAYLDGARLNV
jgi:phenylalanyl-tRNA synthetase alpha chain